MYCQNCGNKLGENANFCRNCGTKKANENLMKDNNIEYQIIPKFHFLYKFIKSMILVALLLIASLSIIDNFSFFLLTHYKFYFYILILILVIASIITIIEKEKYKELVYNFYKTKVEYKSGFLYNEQKELKYENIKEVTLSQDVLERMFNIGTIKLFTSASNNKKNGIYIHCIENVEEQYRIIKQIIEK